MSNTSEKLLNRDFYCLISTEPKTYTEIFRSYKNRFKIEKCFQDLKSSGFDIENSKIRKYSNYKRLLAMCTVAHALLVLLGNFIVSKIPHFLKNSEEMVDATLAFFQSEGKHTSYFQKKYCQL